MNTKLRRARLSRAERLREKIWLQIHHQMKKYAERVGYFFEPSFGTKLTGNNHVRRVVLDSSKPLQMAMPHKTLKPSRSRRKNVAVAEDYENYCEWMLAAGVDVTRDLGCPLISPRHALAALAIFRLSETVHMASPYSDSRSQVLELIRQVKQIRHKRNLRVEQLAKAETHLYLHPFTKKHT